MRVRTKTEGVTKDVEIIDVNAENYIVPENEREQYHCKIEIVRFDAKTGKRLSHPRIQKFGKKVFETNAHHNLQRQGYTIEILHNPNEYIKELEAKKQADAAKIAEAKAKAAEEKKAREEAEIQARIDAAVAKALAEREAKKDAEDNDAKAKTKK